MARKPDRTRVPKDMMDVFLNAYLEAAWWTEKERLGAEARSNAYHGQLTLPDRMTPTLKKFTAESIKRAKADLAAFFKAAAEAEQVFEDELKEKYGEDYDFPAEVLPSDVQYSAQSGDGNSYRTSLLMNFCSDVGPIFVEYGYAFWLSRNGYGTGFFDKPEIFGAEFCERLQDIAQQFGAVNAFLYRGKVDLQ